DDEQQAPPEDGHGVADKGGAHQALVDPCAAAGGGPDAGGYADDDGEDDRAERELEGRGEEFQELADDRRMGRDRLAEVAMQHVPDVAEVLLPQRLVEAELYLQLLVALGGDAVLAGEGEDGIAGEDAD